MTDTNDTVSLYAFLLKGDVELGIDPLEEVTLHFSEETTRRMVKEMRALSSTESD